MAKYNRASAMKNGGKNSARYSYDNAKSNGACMHGDLWKSGRGESSVPHSPSNYGGTGGPLKQHK